MAKPQYRRAHWGLLVVDPPIGARLQAVNPRDLFIPGSTTKLFTISTAWNTLGPGHRFTTPVYPLGTRHAMEKLRLRLAMIREARGATQTELAAYLGTTQSNVSQLERSKDQMLSSVARCVHALGGELKVSAVFGDTTYTLVEDVEAEAPTAASCT